MYIVFILVVQCKRWHVLIKCNLMYCKHLQPAAHVTSVLRSCLTTLSHSHLTRSWLRCRLVHLDVEGCSEELLRQQSYAIKNQIGHQKPPIRGFGTQYTPIGRCFAWSSLPSSLWHKTAGGSISRKALDQWEWTTLLRCQSSPTHDSYVLLRTDYRSCLTGYSQLGPPPHSNQHQSVL